MTASVHPHRAGPRPLTEHARHPLDHAPEVLLALAAVLVVLGGPVARALAPHSPAVTAGSALVLLVGIVLAVVAAARLLRDQD